MSVAATTPAHRAAGNALAQGLVPSWARPAVLGGAIVVGAIVAAITGWNWFVFALVAAIVFLVAYPLWVRAVEGTRKALNAFWGSLVWAAFLLALFPLVSITITVVGKGVQGMTEPAFFTQDMTTASGLADQAAAAGEGPLLGGIKHALIGTLIITLLATIISVPIGLMTSIWLVEYSRGGWLAKVTTFLVDVMTGIPSIVAGLFAVSMMISFMSIATGGGPTYNKETMGITAAIALSVLMIPVVVRSTEEMLRVVPNELREASYALGVRKWRTIFQVVLPTAMSGIASGITLAIARVAGETAPILLTAGVTVTTNWNAFASQMQALPVYIYNQLTLPTAPAAPEPSALRAWGGALVLIIIVMLLNLLARIIASKFAPKTSKR